MERRGGVVNLQISGPSPFLREWNRMMRTSLFELDLDPHVRDTPIDSIGRFVLELLTQEPPDNHPLNL